MKLEFTNIREMVAMQARRYQDRIAIRFYERDITRVANGLLKLGVGKGDRVCMLMDNSPEFYYTYFGIIKIGGIAGPVNCWWQIGEIQYLLKDSGAVALFCDHNYRGHIDKIINKTPDLKHVIEREATDDSFLSFEKMLTESTKLTDVEISPDDVSTIVYTSGTTGNPKGVLLTHRNILTNSWQASLLANIDENDVIMCILPLFHVNGLVITGTSPLTKGSQIVLRRNFSASEFWECVAKYRVSIFSGVPTVYQILLNTHGFEGLDVSSLRYGVCGAAPMPVGPSGSSRKPLI